MLKKLEKVVHLNRWKSMHSKVVRLALLIAPAGVGLACIAHAQQVISAQSGTVHYIEGMVYTGGQVVDRKFGQFPALKPGEELETKDGRAEVLLTPGAFLRVAENSSVRLVSTRLSDTRVEVLNGSAMVECDELLPDNSLALVYHDEEIRLAKKGLYRLDADRAEFGVYDGEAVVRSDASQLTLKSGKETNLNGVLYAEHFDTRVADSFYDWSKQRSAYLAYATVSAGQSLRSSGRTWGGGWGFSPMLDEFTFIPGAGIVYSPFGWQFWSPYTTGLYAYVPPYYYGAYFGGGSGFVGSGGTQPTNGNGLVHRGTPRGNGEATGFAGRRGTITAAPTAMSRSASNAGFRGGSSSGFSGVPSSGGFSGGSTGAGGHAGGGGGHVGGGGGSGGHR
jgi:hypothetical protein